MNNRLDLSTYNNSWYSPGASMLKMAMWYVINSAVFKNSLFPFGKLKLILLKLFGARIGKGVVVKPCVNIKYPWNLSIGDYVWVGENVWIDNLTKVTIGSNVCISQGAMLLCGNHDYKSKSFDLIVREITLEDGVWVGAKSTVCPGVTMHTHSVLSVGSIASHDLEAYAIYQGNPAKKIRDRVIKEE